MYSWIKQESINDYSIQLYDLVAREQSLVTIKEILFNDDNIEMIKFKEKKITLKQNQSLCLRGYHQTLVVLHDYPSTYYYNNGCKHIIMDYKHINHNYMKIKNKNRKLDVRFSVKVEYDKNKCFISETLVKS